VCVVEQPGGGGWLGWRIDAQKQHAVGCQWDFCTAILACPRHRMSERVVSSFAQTCPTALKFKLNEVRVTFNLQALAGIGSLTAAIWRIPLRQNSLKRADSRSCAARIVRRQALRFVCAKPRLSASKL
jgi:hypothetical protein